MTFEFKFEENAEEPFMVRLLIDADSEYKAGNIAKKVLYPRQFRAIKTVREIKEGN